MGWQEDQDVIQAARAKDGGRTPAPWHWEIEDYSAATLCGGSAKADATIGHVMTVSPCEACAARRKETGWQWGACMTPSEADANLIAAAPHMLEALRALVHPDNSAIVYFVPSDAWAQKLLADVRAAIAKAEGRPSDLQEK